MKRAQYAPCDSAKVRPCTLERHQAPSLPPPESEGFPRLAMELFTDHDEFPSLVIFQEEPLHMHRASPIFLNIRSSAARWPPRRPRILRAITIIPAGLVSAAPGSP